MDRLTLALRAAGCYLLGLLLGVPLVMAALVVVSSSKFNDGIFVLLYWMLGGVVSLPFYLALLTIMLVFADNLLTYLERWCLVLPVAITLAMPSTVLIVLLVASGQLPTLQELERGGKYLAGFWVFGAALTFPCAAISTGSFYFWMTRFSPARLNTC